MTENQELERDVSHAMHQLFPNPDDVSLLSGMQYQLARRHRVRVRGAIGVAVAAGIAAIAVSVALVGGNSGRTQAAPSTSSVNDNACATAVSYAGRTYVGVSLRTKPPYNKIGTILRSHRHQIGHGTIPPCGDTNTQKAPTSEPVTVDRIDGVPSNIAIALDTTGRVYLRRNATLPATLPSQPWIHWTTP